MHRLYAATSLRLPILISALISALVLLLAAAPLRAQSNSGELRLTVTDPSGLGVRAQVELLCAANQYHKTFVTGAQGRLDLERLPYGIYRYDIEKTGFAPQVGAVEVNTALPIDLKVGLRLATVSQSVTVSAAATLIDPDQAGAVTQVGSGFIQDRAGSIPGRDLEDLVNAQPGWLYEGNAVLHPRGSEYQTQFVLDGIPLTDNRSPSFGPEIEAGDVESMSIYTAGFPAEYGRKMGGVVELDTREDPQPGFHGRALLSGGSYGSAGVFARAELADGRNAFGGSASGSMTDHYLNPVVPQNFSNTGTLGDFSLDYARDLTAADKLKLGVRHELARYDIPNELVQQAAGQRQTADNLETMGTSAFTHTFSPTTAVDLRGMVRNNQSDFESNPASTPIDLTQHNWFREGYFKAGLTADRGRSEWKAGVESDNTFLNEDLSYLITDPTQFDPGSPLTFAYRANRPDLEQSGFVQDLIRLRNWTINAGLRWDHYQLLVNQQAVEPRLAVSHYFPGKNAVLHFSYDRIFQTPSFENILLSSSPAVASIDPGGFLRLPVRPSTGDYYEAGLTGVFAQHVKLTGNYFRRFVGNYADDSQIDNTTISFPIAFRKAILYGLEGHVEVTGWHGWSGWASYSYIVGNAWFPVTGGLFFGPDAAQAAQQLSGHFPDSQDQRNTARGRLRYQFTPRLWAAFGAQFDSGLPFDFDGDPGTALAQYGPAVFSRLNFARGRILPAFQASALAGADLYQHEGVKLHLEADGQNLNNILNVIDFNGLFSGNAIGPARSWSLRLAADF